MKMLQMQYEKLIIISIFIFNEIHRPDCYNEGFFIQNNFKTKDAGRLIAFSASKNLQEYKSVHRYV